MKSKNIKHGGPKCLEFGKLKIILKLFESLRNKDRFEGNFD